MIKEVNHNIGTINQLSQHSRENLKRVSEASDQVSNKASELNELVREFKV